jgi:hypothetical protein
MIYIIIPLALPLSLRRRFRNSGSGKLGGSACPGKGKIHAAKTGARLFLAGAVLNLLSPEGKSRCL